MRLRHIDKMFYMCIFLLYLQKSIILLYCNKLCLQNAGGVQNCARCSA